MTSLADNELHKSSYQSFVEKDIKFATRP